MGIKLKQNVWCIITFCIILVSSIYASRLYVSKKSHALRQDFIKKVDFYQNNFAETSSVPIEVVLPAIEKDFPTLPYAVASIRKNIKQPISKITLISPKSEASISLAKQLDLTFLDENELLSLDEFKAWINNNNTKLHNVTWYYQQFLKLLYHRVAKEKYYFVMDADVVLTSPVVFVSDFGITTFFVGHNIGHESYKLSVEKLLGDKQFVPEFSFVADMMCFDRYKVADMLSEIENRLKLDWYKAALLVEQNTAARFSEFELYGSYFNFNPAHGIVKSNFRKHHGIILSRKNLEKNLNSIEFKFVPYMAFHSYATQEFP